MKLYQLVAYGESFSFDSQMRLHSRKVFVDREAALAHESEFRGLCLQGEELSRLLKVEKVRVIELELARGDGPAPCVACGKPICLAKGPPFEREPDGSPHACRGVLPCPSG